MNLCKFLGLSYQKALVGLLLLPLFVLAACQRAPLPFPIAPPVVATDAVSAPTPSEIPIPFDTILNDTGMGGPDYHGIQPMFVVLRSKTDIRKLRQIFSDNFRAGLEDFNYQDRVILIVFQGYKPDTCYQVTIKQVYRYNNGPIIVNADFVVPTGVMACGAAMTSPFHIISIPVTALAANDQAFELLNNHAAVPDVKYLY